MSLAAGSRLGPYEIQALIGAGGMGEVYTARDTRLDRIVAIKVLPTALARDPDRTARFEREARAIAALNHPHICTLHDIGQQDETTYLVMEHLDGQSLAARLRRGRLPLPQVLEVGAQIADALAAAHRAGIVHRDLKPANVMLVGGGRTEGTAGTVKLLDFGLAKLTAHGDAPAATMEDAATETPTLTGRGTIVGTLPYMAPEQVQGLAADARTDIWALGAILYEMATGVRAFDAGSAPSLIAAILAQEPPSLTARVPLTPPAVERLVKRCLAKTPDERWQSADDLAAELRWVAQSRAAQEADERPGRRRAFAAGALAAATLCAFAAVLVVALEWLPAGPNAGTRPQAVAATLEFPAGLTLTGGLALSPDGRTLAFAGRRSDGADGVWIRDIDAFDVRLLEGTQGATDPFWSPRGDALGFFTETHLKRVGLHGGPATVVTQLASSPRGGTWNRGDVIVFGDGANSPLYRVPANGGRAVPLTTLDPARGDTSHRFPTFLPDGSGLLFLIGRRSAPSCLATMTLDAPQGVCLEPGESTGEYLNGAVYYLREHSLMTQPFDLARRRTSGTPVPVLERVWRELGTYGRSGCSVSANDVVACRAGAPGTRIQWVEPGGRVSSVVGPEGSVNPVLSPDGRHLLVTAYSADNARDMLWVVEGQNAWTLSRPDMNVELSAWHPKGNEVVYSADTAGTFDIYVQRVERGSSPRLVLQSPAYEVVTDWSSDGQWILFDRDADVFRLSTSGGQPIPIIQTRAHEVLGRFSPDLRWISYQSDESGRYEVYLLPFSGGEPVRVSTDGGTQAQWRSDSSALYFAQRDGSLVSVSLDTRRTEGIVGPPRLVLPSGTLHDFGYEFSYAVGPNGTSFAVNAQPDSALANRVSLLVGWRAESRSVTR